MSERANTSGTRRESLVACLFLQCLCQARTLHVCAVAMQVKSSGTLPEILLATTSHAPTGGAMTAEKLLPAIALTQGVFYLGEAAVEIGLTAAWALAWRER